MRRSLFADLPQANALSFLGETAAQLAALRECQPYGPVVLDDQGM